MSERGSRTVIIGDESLEARTYLETVLQAKGYSVLLAENGQEVLDLLQNSESVALVLLDVRMPVKDGIETLRELRLRHNGLPVILMSHWPVDQLVVQTAEEHKARILEKPLLPDSFSVAVASGLQLKLDDGQYDSLREPVQAEHIAPDSYLWRMENLIRQVGRADVPVLVQGETGVGKEVLARQIHSRSPRAKKPFVKVNCAALPSELVESELFGYERGAFSGAYGQSQGLFETADQGTILLDEIGDMDVRLQAKLLQVLQDGEFRRLGGKELIRVDVRVMAATHQNLREAIEARRFREDLYYRLNVVDIRIPPLRERREEILPLAEHLLRKHATRECPTLPIPSFLRDTLLQLEWPGNVRELENAMRRFLILRDPAGLARDLRGGEKTQRSGETLTSPSFPSSTTVPELDSDQVGPLDRVERATRAAETDAVRQALEATHWNRKRAAELLKIDYKALLYKMKKLGIGTRRGRSPGAEAGESRSGATGVNDRAS